MIAVSIISGDLNFTVVPNNYIHVDNYLIMSLIDYSYRLDIRITIYSRY